MKRNSGIREINRLTYENQIFYKKLLIIRDCEDPKCYLCSKCLSAVMPDIIELKAPEIVDNDPVRNTGRSNIKNKKWITYK